MFLYYLLGWLLITLFVAIKPSLAFKIYKRIDQSFRPVNADDSRKLFITAMVYYFGLLFPVVFLLELLFGIIGVYGGA